MTLRLEDITIKREDVILIDGLTLHIEPGDIGTIMGESGVGKSTLLALISGVLDPGFSWSGRVLLNEKSITDLPVEARNVGLLFQDPLLFPHMSVGQNIAFGLPEAMDKQARHGEVEDALDLANMSGFADRDPATLSGGQRARVALLRSLLARPSLLLLDEPFSKLDQGLRERMRRFVFENCKRRHIPALLVTHDFEDARAANGPLVTLVRKNVNLH